MVTKDEAAALLRQAGLHNVTPLRSGQQAWAFRVTNAAGEALFAKVPRSEEAARHLAWERGVLWPLQPEWAASFPGQEQPFPRVREVNERFTLFEFIEGRSLREHLTSPPGSASSPRLEPRTAERLAREIGAVLDWIHGLGFFHCDVGPHNIMVCDDGRFMLIDFGKVRSLRADRPPSIGYPSDISGVAKIYLAPEWCGAEPPDADDRTAHVQRDLYALGATVHECIEPEWAEQQAQVPYPEERDNGVGEDFADSTLGFFIRDACATDPQTRPDSFATAMNSAEATMRDLTDESRPTIDMQRAGGLSRSGRPPKPGTRARLAWWFAGAGAILLLGVVTLGLVLWQISRSEPGLVVPEQLTVADAVIGSQAGSVLEIQNPADRVRVLEVGVPARWAAAESLRVPAGGRAALDVSYAPTGYDSVAGTLRLHEVGGGSAEAGTWLVALVGTTNRDADGDGVPAVGAGGADCDDAAAGVHPGAFDVPGDGVDQDCSGEDAAPAAAPPTDGGDSGGGVADSAATGSGRSGSASTIGGAPRGDTRASNRVRQGTGAGEVGPGASREVQRGGPAGASAPRAADGAGGTTVLAIGVVDGGRPPSLATEYSANPLAFTRAGVALPDHPQRWAANGPAEADELAATCAETLRGRPLTGPLCQQVSVCALQARPNDELSKLCDQCDTVVGRENLLGCAKVAGIPSTELGRM